MIRYVKNPYELLWECRDKYGDIFTVHTTMKVVVIGHPEGVKTVFAAGPEQYQVKLLTRQKQFTGELSLPNFFGKAHLRERKIVAPPFRSGYIEEFGALMKETMLRHAQRWQQQGTFDMKSAAKAIGLEIIIQAVLGIRDPVRMAEFRDAFLEYVGIFSSPVFLLSSLFHLNLRRVGPFARLEKVRQVMDAMIYREIEQKKKHGGDSIDALAHMIHSTYEDGTKMDDQKLRDNVYSDIIAGFETSSFTIMWAMYWLHKHRGVLKKLLDELDALPSDPAAGDFLRLPYLDAVVKETMRLYPVSTDVFRCLAKPLDIMGYQLPADTYISACPSLVHYREDLYPSPQEFRPERFLEREYSPYEYFPFGGAERMCIGKHFALFEIKLVLGLALKQFQFECLSTGPLKLKRLGFFVGPADGVQIRCLGGRKTPGFVLS